MAFFFFLLCKKLSCALKEFSLYLYIRPNLPNLAFGAVAGDTRFPGRQEEVGQWQRLNGTFNPPVKEFVVYGYFAQGELFPAHFLIDTVELMTIPEPATSWLLGLGLLTGIFWLRQRSTGFTPSEATEGITCSPTSAISASSR